MTSYKIRVITSGKLKQHTYVVTTDTHAVVIDPDLHSASILCRELEKLEVIVLLTHGHYDHVGGLDQIYTKFNADIYIHELDRVLLGQAPIYGIKFANEKIKRFINVKTFNGQFGEVTDQFGIKLRFCHVPGHTLGSVIYIIDNFLFTGDTIFKESIGPILGITGNRDQLIGSINGFLNFPLAVDDYDVFPGHGESFKLNEFRAWWKDNKNSPTTFGINYESKNQ